MMLETFIPADGLKPYVRCYMIVECSETVINSMLPGTSLIMGLRYRGNTKYLSETENKLSFAVVAGLRKSVQLMQDESGTGNLLVIFTTAGAKTFFSEPLHTLFGEVLPLAEFSNFKSLNKVEDELSGATTNAQRISIVNQFLLSRLSGCYHDPLVEKATQIIRAHQGFIKIRDLAANLFISLDAFEKRFRKSVGASPKQFCHIVRMNEIIGNINQQSLAQTAFDAGYYDQAHFSKDFKTFTGQTPTEYLKQPTP